MDNLQHDIERYLRGDMSPAEMHALEKKALTDPFLADALEGGESLTHEDFTADLKNIKSALTNRIENKGKQRTIFPLAFRIAAGLLLLAVSTIIIINLVGEKEKTQELALNKHEAASEVQQPPQPTTKIESKEIDNADVNQNETVEKEPNMAASQTYLQNKTVPNRTTDEFIAQNEVVREEFTAPEMEVIAEQAPVAQDSAYIAVDEISKSLPIASTTPELDKRKENIAAGVTMQGRIAAATKEGKIITGKVTDAEDGTILPGVTVTIKNTNIGTTTNENGEFKLQLDDPNAELVFSFVGLQNVEVPVANRDNVEVSMSADYASLSEVVVVGYGENNNVVYKEGEDRNVYAFAEPKGGKKAFRNYLVQNVRYPQQALENKIEGKVTVQFMVETSGLLDDFRVTKGLGYGCDEEVIRLIKGGPKWSPSKRNDVPYRGRVKVRFRFKLPD